MSHAGQAGTTRDPRTDRRPGDEPTLREVVNRWLSADLAELVGRTRESASGSGSSALLKPAAAAETFGYLDLPTSGRCSTPCPTAESASILNAMAPDDRTALLAELPAEQARAPARPARPRAASVARALLDYREESVGRLMTPDYVVVRKDWTIRHVLDHVRAHGRDSETLNVIYVVDDHEQLIDDLRIREILLAPLHAHVADLMDGQFVSLARDRRQEDRRRGLPQVRPHRAAGRRRPRAAWPGS